MELLNTVRHGNSYPHFITIRNISKLDLFAKQTVRVYWSVRL